MRCTRSSALRFEIQLPILHETPPIRRPCLKRAIVHKASQRRIHSDYSQTDHDGTLTEHPTASPKTSPHVIHNLLSEVLARSEKLRHQKTSTGNAPPRTSFLRQKAQSIAAGRVQDIAQDEEKAELPRTITGDEKAIFKQIFDNLAKGKPVTTRLSQHEGTPDITTDSSFDLDAFLYNVNVDTILSELYGSSAGRKDELLPRQDVPNVSREEVERYPKALRRMALKARAAVETRSNQGRAMSEASRDTDAPHVSESNAVDAPKICLEALQKLSREIDRRLAIRQDYEQALIEFCEEYVFRLMPGDKAMEALGYPVKAIAAHRKALQAQKKEQLKSTEKGGEAEIASTEDIPLASDSVNDGSMFNMPRELHLPGGDTMIPENIAPLEVLSTLCPAAMVLAVRYLALKCPNSSLLSSFLTTLHAMGPEAYVLGSSTALYNTLLAHTWIQFSDLQAMEHILIDMRAGAVAFDVNTIHILDVIREERFYALSRRYLGDVGADDQTLRPAWWWQLGSTPQNFQRVTEGWRQTIANTLEESGVSEDIPEITYSDEMLESLRGDSSQSAVML